jgi:hypothetical protein
MIKNYEVIIVRTLVAAACLLMRVSLSKSGKAISINSESTNAINEFND